VHSVPSPISPNSLRHQPPNPAAPRGRILITVLHSHLLIIQNIQRPIRPELHRDGPLEGAAALAEGAGWAEADDFVAGGLAEVDAVVAAGTIGGVQPNQILIEPELAADANMDGKVDFNDLLILAQNNGSITGDWTHADFNYDGKVDFNDLLLLAQNINQTNGTTLLGGELPASFEAQWQLAQAEVKAADGVGSVPEPGTLSLMAIGAAGLLVRRRRAAAAGKELPVLA